MVEVEVPVVDGVNFLLGERRIVLSRKVMGTLSGLMVKPSPGKMAGASSKM